MTIYYMGGEIGTFTPADANAGEGTSTLGKDPNFSRVSISVNGGSSSNTSSDFSLPDEWWFHAYIANRFANVAFKYYYFRTATTDVLRLGFNQTSIKVEVWSGIAWVEVIAPTTVDMGSDAEQTIDLHVTGNSASGEVALYIAGVKRDEQTADLSTVVGIENLKIAGAASYGGSQFVIADEPTTGWRLMTYVPTGAGATGDWTGDYTGIDESVNSDADFINSGTANQVELFTTTPVGSITGYIPRAVGVYCRAKCGAGGPQNLQLALRSAGTTYFSGSKALDVGYGGFGHIWNQDPATSADFLSGALAALQPGVKSIT